MDSCVIIGSYFPDDPNHEVCKSFMDNLVEGEFECLISIFGLAEIGGFISRNSNPELAKKFTQELLDLPNLHIAYVSGFENFMNSVLLVSVLKGLSGADAIHLVSALSSVEVDEFVTVDHDFNRVSDMIRVTNLRK